MKLENITLEEKLKSNVNNMTEKKISVYGNGILIPLFSKKIPIHNFTSLGYFTTLKAQRIMSKNWPKLRKESSNSTRHRKDAH